MEYENKIIEICMQFTIDSDHDVMNDWIFFISCYICHVEIIEASRVRFSGTTSISVFFFKFFIVHAMICRQVMLLKQIQIDPPSNKLFKYECMKNEYWNIYCMYPSINKCWMTNANVQINMTVYAKCQYLIGVDRNNNFFVIVLYVR